MSNRCNSYFLIQTKHFNLQGVFAGNTYNTHVFVNLTIYMDHFYLDYIIHFILHYIYTSDIISMDSMDSTGTQPPHKKTTKKTLPKKTSRRSLRRDIDRTDGKDIMAMHQKLLERLEA